MPTLEFSSQELREMNKAREAVGLPLLKKTVVVCMLCLKRFRSLDKLTNRRCPNCVDKLMRQDLSVDFCGTEDVYL